MLSSRKLLWPETNGSGYEVALACVGLFHSTLPLLTWRRLSTEYPGKFFGGP